MPYIRVKDLPETLQSLLKACDYHRSDICVNVKETESLLCPGGSGYKGFTIIVNLSTGESRWLNGSWGGANMFNPTNAVDLDQTMYTLPNDCAIIKGTIGGTTGSTFASITIPPSNASKYLPESNTLSDKDKSILGVYRSYKPSYRKDELYRIGCTQEDLDILISQGYLKRDGRGIQITTKGKNSI